MNTDDILKLATDIVERQIEQIERTRDTHGGAFNRNDMIGIVQRELLVALNPPTTVPYAQVSGRAAPKSDNEPDPEDATFAKMLGICSSREAARDIRKLLSTHLSSNYKEAAVLLIDAFFWVGAPQGCEYWNAQYRRLYENKPLDADAFEFLKRYLNWLNAKSAIKPKTSHWDSFDFSKVKVIAPGAIKKVLTGNHGYLNSAFTWITSPQGGDYWRLRLAGKVQLNDDDLDFLRRLYTHHTGKAA